MVGCPFTISAINSRLNGGQYFSGIISPVLISDDAAFTRVGVRRLMRPSLRMVRPTREVESIPTHIVIVSPDPSGSRRCAWAMWYILSIGKFSTLWIEWNCASGLVESQNVFDLVQSSLSTRHCFGWTMDKSVMDGGRGFSTRNSLWFGSSRVKAG